MPNKQQSSGFVWKSEGYQQSLWLEELQGSLSDKHTTHTLSLFLFFSCSYSHTHTHTYIHTHTQTLSLSHTHTHSHTHIQTHTHVPFSNRIDKKSSQKRCIDNKRKHKLVSFCFVWCCHLLRSERNFDCCCYGPLYFSCSGHPSKFNSGSVISGTYSIESARISGIKIAAGPQSIGLSI